MKTKVSFLIAFLCAVLLTSCGSEPEYAKFIPKEAAVVGRINVGEIAKKGDLADNASLADILKKAVKGSNLSAKGKVLAEKIISDPTMMGIDLRKPVYYYYNTNNESDQFGIIAAVLDRDNLKDFLNFCAKENNAEGTKEENDMTYLETDNIISVFNDTWLIVKEKGNDDAKTIIQSLLARMELQPEQTIESDAGYVRMLKSDGLFQLLVKGDILSKLMGNINNVNNNNEASKELTNFDYIFNLDSDDGEITLDYEPYATTDEGRNKLAANKKLYDEIQGEYANFINENALFTLVCNIHGKECVAFIEKLSLPTEQVQMIAKYLGAINGDVVYTINQIKPNLSDLDMRMFAKVSNPNPFLELKSIGTQIPGVKEFAANEFSFSLGQMLPISDLVSEIGLAAESAAQPNGNILVNFGVNNNSNVYASLALNSNGFDKVQNPINKDVFHGRCAYCYFNSTNALDIVKLWAKNNNQADDYEFKIGTHVLGQIDYAEFYTTTEQKCKLKIVMRDKDKDGLATFFSEITNIVNIFS